MWRGTWGVAVALLSLSLASGSPEVSTAFAFRAGLLEGTLAGESMLLVSDCSRLEVGQRLRVGQGTDHEEEGEVLRVRCPPASAALSATVPAEPPCDLATLSDLDMAALSTPPSARTHGSTPPSSAAAGKLPAHCRALLEAARSIPGLAESYRSARKAGGALLPDPLVLAAHGRPLAHGPGARAHEPLRSGAATLKFSLLYSHPSGEPVHGYAAGALLALTCPGSVGGAVCSGHGTCDAAAGTCACLSGWGGVSAARLELDGPQPSPRCRHLDEVSRAELVGGGPSSAGLRLRRNPFLFRPQPSAFTSGGYPPPRPIWCQKAGR